MQIASWVLCLPQLPVNCMCVILLHTVTTVTLGCPGLKTNTQKKTRRRVLDTFRFLETLFYLFVFGNFYFLLTNVCVDGPDSSLESCKPVYDCNPV